MKAQKRTLWATGLSMILCLALLVGTTFAWFTDSVKNTGNNIQAGTLDIELTPGADKPMFSSEGFLWEPGRSQKATATVENVGSLWLKYTMSFENVVTEGNANITEVLDVYLVDANAGNLDGAQKLGTMAELMKAGSFAAKDAVLAPAGTSEDGYDDTDSFTLVIKMQETAGNEYQNAGVTFDVKVLAAQYNHEKDGFGNPDYDKNAAYDPVVVVDDAAKLQDAINNAEEGSTILLDEDLTVDQTITINKPVTIDGNGATFKAPTDKQTIYVASDDVTIMNCNLGRTGKGHAIWINDNKKNVVIKDNTLTGPIQATNVQNVTIENNTFTLGYDVAAVTISGTTKDLTFANNTVNGFFSSYCVRFYGDGAGLSNIVLENNTKNSSVKDVDMSKATFDLDAFIANGTITIK